MITPTDKEDCEMLTKKNRRCLESGGSILAEFHQENLFRRACSQGKSSKRIAARLLTIGFLGLGLSGCSTIVKGTDQEIAINTNPVGANCVLEREGKEIARLDNTPGTVTVSKLKHDITIICNKVGYQTATYINGSGWESGAGAAGIALDVVLTLGISSAVDSATGADNRYESPVNITMIPAS